VKVITIIDIKTKKTPDYVNFGYSQCLSGFYCLLQG